MSLEVESPLVGNTRPTLYVNCEPNSRPDRSGRGWVPSIGAICWNLQFSCGFAKTRAGDIGDLLGDPLGRKEGRRGTKIRSMNRRKTSLALEKGCFKRIEHCQALRGIGILTRRMSNWNACVGW